MNATTEKVLEGEVQHRYELGLHEGLSDVEYRRAPGANKSFLDDVNVSPAFARWRKHHPAPPTEAMNIGQALHTLVLEPHLFSQRFVRAKYEEFRTKEAREWRVEQESKGLTVLRIKSDDPDRNPSEWDRVHSMADAVLAHPMAGPLFADEGPTEATLFWVDKFAPGARRLCKARLDKWCTGHRVIADLKKVPIQGAGESNFARKVHEYRYHVQAAFYFDGAWTLDLKPQAFIFVAVEEDPPYQVACYTLPDEWIRQGRQQYIRDLEVLSRCIDSAEWPSYPPEIRQLSQPPFARAARIY